MGEVFLRGANVFDSKQLAEIKNYYIENTDVIFTSEKALCENIALDIEKNHNRYIIAECDKEIIGYACLLDYRVGGYYITKEVSVYLKQGAVGLGVGHTLLEALIVRGKLLGLTTLVAYINSTNTKSLSLFKRNGFEKAGELKNVATKFGKYLDVSILQLQLK